MRASTLTAIMIASLATAGFSAEKARKPRLDLRAAPRMAFSPVNVLLTAELMGGEDVDQLYCPEIEWNWDDGGKSVHESDCAPLEAGGTCNGPPGIRAHYHPNYYGAFVHDPDGHNIEAVCHDPEDHS